MQEDTIAQAAVNSELPTPKQFRANFKEIYESETTFGSTKAAREELLENVQDIIQTYLDKGCRIVYLHGKLKEAGYTGSRNELSKWLVAKGLWTKREVTENTEAKGDNSENVSAKTENFQEKICANKSSQDVEEQETDQNKISGAAKSQDPSLGSDASSLQNAKPQINITLEQNKFHSGSHASSANVKSPGNNVANSPDPAGQVKN